MDNENDQQQDYAGPQATNSEFNQQTSGRSSAPDTRHKKQPSSYPTTQLKGDPPNDRKIKFTIVIDEDLTGAQLIERVELYIYKQRVNHVWKIAGTPIDPNKVYKAATYSVGVLERHYRKNRTKTEQGVGVELTKEGTVPNAKERVGALGKLPKAEQDALQTEIKRRFKEATGQTAKDPNTEAIWDTIRDEVLAQREKVTNLSAKAKLIIQSSDKGGIAITPPDYPQWIRFLQKIDALDRSTVEEYASRTSAHAANLETLKKSLQQFLDEKGKSKNEKEKRTTIENELFGSEGVQSDLATFQTLAITSGLGGVGGIGSANASMTFYDSAQEKARALGFKDIADYEAHIKAYLASFQKEAASTGVALLQKYEHMLFEEEQRYLNTEDAQQLGNAVTQTGAGQQYKEADTQRSYASMASGVPANLNDEQLAHIQGMHDRADNLEQQANTSMQRFQPGHPLLKDPAFDLKALSQQTPDKTREYLLNYISEQREKISSVKSKILSDQEYVFTLDNLMKHMYEKESLQPNSVPYKAIQEHISSIKLKDALISIGIAVLAISLGLVSGGGGTAGVLAAVGSAGLSIYDVTREFQQYTNKKNAHDVGMLTDNPTFAWVVLALVGAGIDFAAVGKLLKSLKAPVETFEATAKTDPVKALEELETTLSTIGEIDKKMAANILKRAEHRAELLSKLTSTNIVQMQIVPGSKELLDLAVYAVKSGITKVEDLFLLLQKHGLKKRIGDLSTEEANALKEALETAALKNVRDTAKSSFSNYTNISQWIDNLNKDAIAQLEAVPTSLLPKLETDLPSLKVYLETDANGLSKWSHFVEQNIKGDWSTDSEFLDLYHRLSASSSTTTVNQILGSTKIKSVDQAKGLLGHGKIDGEMAQLETLLKHKKVSDALSLQRLLDHKLVPSAEDLAKALEVESIKNTRQLYGLISKNPHVQDSIRAGGDFDQALKNGIDEMDKAKAAKRKAREAAEQLSEITPTTKALFDNPSSIWGKSQDELKSMLEADGFVAGGYKGESTAEKFVRQGPPYLEIRINFGGGTHYPEARSTPWYYIVQKDNNHYRIIDKNEIGNFQGGDLFNEKYVVYDGPTGAKLGGPKKE